MKFFLCLIIPVTNFFRNSIRALSCNAKIYWFYLYVYHLYFEVYQAELYLEVRRIGSLIFLYIVNTFSVSNKLSYLTITRTTSTATSADSTNASIIYSSPYIKILRNFFLFYFYNFKNCLTR